MSAESSREIAKAIANRWGAPRWKDMLIKDIAAAIDQAREVKWPDTKRRAEQESAYGVAWVIGFNEALREMVLLNPHLVNK